MEKARIGHATLMPPAMRILIGRRILEVIEGDITRVEADAIVNAANSRLMGGGGVDGAIHDAAGPSVMAECEKYDGCPTGTTVATGAGRLKAKYIFHAVGPEWDDGQQGERDVLRATYLACLALAKERNCRTIAFPAISTGVYAFPMIAAAEVALSTIGEHLAGETCVEHVMYVLYGGYAYRDAARVARKLSEARGWQITEEA